MRTLFLLPLLLFGLHSFSQQSYVEKSDGTKETVANVRIDDVHKKAIYRISGEKKDTKTKFAGLKAISFGNFTFRIFRIGKKYEGFYIISQTPSKILGFREFTRTYTHGGFDSYVKHVDVAIFDIQNNLLERFDLRESDNEKSLAIKQETIEAIRIHFADCPKLLEKLDENLKSEDKRKIAMLPIFGKRDNMIDCH